MRNPTARDLGWGAAIFLAAVSCLALRVPDPSLLLTSNDQGYQMALGMAVAKGYLPGLDFVTQYGPAVAVASYLGFALSGNAVGEMCISIVGYAGAVTIAAAVVRRAAGVRPAYAVAVAMLLWFPRFYKWYYYLFPLLGLWLAERYYRRDRQRSVPALLVWSQVTGLAGLFRYDLALAGGVAGALAIVAAHYADAATRPRFALREVAIFLSGILVLPLIFVMAIYAARGEGQVVMFLRSLVDGTSDTIEYYAVSPFTFSGTAVLSAENALALLQIVVPSTYVIGVVIGFRGLRSGRAEAFVLLCASLTGLSVYPQAMHRADLQHLLQVIAPFVIAVALLARQVASTSRPGFGDFAAIAALSAIAGLMVAVLPGAAMDLAPVGDHPVSRWKAIAGLPGSRPDQPAADMALAIRRMTPSEATVFLVMTPTDMSMLFFAERHQPGIFPTYEPGMFAGPYWTRRNQAALEKSPPDFLVLPTIPDDNPAPFLPALVRQWKAVYTTVLYRNQRFELRARPDAKPAGRPAG